MTTGEQVTTAGQGTGAVAAEGTEQPGAAAGVAATTPVQVRVDRDALFVGGRWVPSHGDGRLDVVGAATGEVVATVPDGTAADVDDAVAAARQALPGWAATPWAERAALCGAIAQGLVARGAEIAASACTEVGMPIAQSVLVQVGVAVTDFAAVVEAAPAVLGEERRVGNSVVVREPVGVVGCVTPWNYPLHQVAAKVAPALAAGNTVVVKPSEVAPSTAFLLCEVAEAAGLPAGVLNLVTGRGEVVGEALASHPDVDMISFTGSTRAGRRVAELAAATVKKVSLELGGKSANVLLDDLSDDELTAAVVDGVQKCMLNSGQTCSALTRMVVPRDRLAHVEAVAAEAVASYVLGDPADPTTTLGPLVSGPQLERVRGFLERAVADGARVVAGGAEPPTGVPDGGFFVAPTVLSDVTPDMEVAQEEVFGPVLALLAHDGTDDAVEIANGTSYGLAGGVWAHDREQALAVARRLRTGQVEVNGGVFNPLAPFGGYKQSGTGRELGAWGLEEFTETKALHL